MVLCKRFSVLLGLTALVLAAVLLPVAAAPQGKKKNPEQLRGQPAPPLQADYAVNGKETKLSELKGKVVVLNFCTLWNTTCVNCLPLWNDWQKEFEIRGVVVVGVTVYAGAFKQKLTLNPVSRQMTLAKGALPPEAEKELYKEYMALQKLKFRLWVLNKEEADKAMADYQIEQVPQMVLLDRKGEVREVFVGGEPAVLNAMKQAIDRLGKVK